jgi:hypothetical protein
MNDNSFKHSQRRQGFDLVRLSHSKEAVDICSNTIRAFNREGLALYRKGRAVFFSINELEMFIKTRSATRPQSSVREEVSGDC